MSCIIQLESLSGLVQHFVSRYVVDGWCIGIGKSTLKSSIDRTVDGPCRPLKKTKVFMLTKGSCKWASRFETLGTF